MLIDIDKAKKLLCEGKIVAVPTDTIYGLAAPLDNEKSILNLYHLKKRPFSKPLVIQLSDREDLHGYLSHKPFDLDKLIQQFWPGALTLVLPVNPQEIPAVCRAHLPCAAFRIANHEILRNLIRNTQPLVITSANESSQDESQDFRDVEAIFGENFPVLQDTQNNSSSVASTVLAYVDASWVILRKGQIYLKELRPVIGYNPPVAFDVNFDEKSYQIAPQFHCMDVPYDGSIKFVVGLKERSYMGAERIVTFEIYDQQTQMKHNVLKIIHQIMREKPPHIWVDLNFPKEGVMKEFASLFEQASLWKELP